MPQNVLEITAQEIIRKFQGEGEDFTRFVDDLILGLARVSGIPPSEVRRNLRTNLGDGGVDTEVCAPLPHDPFGFCTGVKTVWQYKARDSSGIGPADLRAEIKGEYCQEKIAEGFAYRLAIADELTPQKQSSWLAALNAEAQNISAGAHPVKIVTASDLGTWASSLSGIKAKYFEQAMLSEFLALADWASIQRDRANQYVDVDNWTEAVEAVGCHCDFSTEVESAVLCVHGGAGVGKSRLVVETLSGLDGAETLVLCTSDGELARGIVPYLVAAKGVYCIILADECLPETRLVLQQYLAPYRDRIRVIATDNSGFEHSRNRIDVVLEPMPGETLGAILSKNFEERVASDRRSHYLNASGGSIRIALELCHEDPLVGDPTSLGHGLEGYLHTRLPAEEQDALAALALVWRIGFNRDVRAELVMLAELVQTPEPQLRALLRRAKQRSGFVTDSGRYMYVSPDAVAQMAFGWAWSKWAADDPGHFLGRVPEQLVDVFTQRVKAHGSEEVRRDVADFFRSWVEGLSVHDLSDPRVAQRACRLAESMPSQLLPLLGRTITQASDEDIRELKGRAPFAGGRGGRRYLVWMLERLCWFGEFFPQVESMLAKLAVAEIETGIANNSRAIYCQIMRIYLSGTPLPFSKRIPLLERRLRKGDEPEQLLAVEALEKATRGFGTSRRGKPAVIGGRAPEEEWEPRTGTELREAFVTCLALLGEASGSQMNTVSQAAANGIAKHARRLLSQGFLPELRSMADSSPALRELRAELISESEVFLRYDLPEKPTDEDTRYIASVREWVDELSSGTLDDRVKATVGRWPRNVALVDGGEEEAARQLADLADELEIADFVRLIPWLCSGAARSGFDFGERLGARDEFVSLIDQVMEATAAHGGTLFARGFARSAAASGRSGEVAAAISLVEQRAPHRAMDVSAAAEPTSAMVERLRRLVSQERLPPSSLAGPLVWSRGVDLSAAETGDLLRDLVSRLDDEATVAEAVRLVGHWLSDKEIAPVVESSEQFADLAFLILEAAADGDGGDSYWWDASLRKLRAKHPERVLKTASRALVANGISHRNEAASILSSLAKTHPALVVAELGKAILDPERGWNFRVGNLKGLAASLPVDLMKGWLEENGLEAARGIARHLPPPRAMGDGEFEVHPLTEYVLTAFEDDDETFQAFVSGTHSQQMYMGDIAAQHQAEADAARPLLSHRLRRIREWAAAEVRRGEADARYWREREEERKSEF